MTTPDHSARIPAETLVDAMDAAREGQTPNLTTASVLNSLHLDGDSPDGRTLIDRLAGGDLDVGVLRSVVFFMMGAAELLHTTNERTATPQQEEVAKILGQVIARQITREGDICDGARDMVSASTRDDIIPLDLRATLEAPLAPDDEPLPGWPLIGFDAVVIPIIEHDVPLRRSTICPPCR